MTVIDGRAKFRCSLAEFYLQPMIVSQVARLGVLLPPVSDLDPDAPPAYAEINPYDNQARWIAHCPDCRVSAEYIWIEGPHQMFCVNCANRGIGHKWRPVWLPTQRRAIEKSLSERPHPMQRAWKPGESLAQVKADTAKAKEGS